ncbi:AAA family ATPase [Helicobacter burdigaliensis]|uniref:AAA family ATPase n=2 Tax=Helicobacter burdigaliensis TaxID=2315334 RepID=UPI000EF722EF|nr:AAA family ATPase [Helicobacter burdigaliensis]
MFPQNRALKQILDIDCNINKNIDRNKEDRGFLSQNILNELRNLLEHIALYVYNTDTNQRLDNIYENLQSSLKYIGDKRKYKDIKNFHHLLQISVSHYTPNEEIAERLMLKYLFYLFQTRNFCKKFLDIQILNNLQDFPINLDTLSFQYYECVVDKIKQTSVFSDTKTDKFYIQKVKPFIINEEIYYEITFTIARDNVSKFDKLIAFSKYYIPSNYSTKLTLYYTNIKLLNLQMPIILITRWNIDIRPCEFANFCLIFKKQYKQFVRNRNYEDFMQFLTREELNLFDIIKLKNKEYIKIKNNFSKDDKMKHLFDCLDISREIILQNKSGANILSYILYTMNNQIIKKQIPKKKNSYQHNPNLSNLFLKYESIPFDDMPFCSSPAGHIPKLNVLFECISPNGREHELLARKIQNNSEINGLLYTDLEDFKEDNIQVLIKKYNGALYYKQKKKRSIKVLHDKYLFINEYQDTIIKIIHLLKYFKKSGLDNYKENINEWLKKNNKLDCEEKKNYLSNLFCNSKLALIYGAAGTGKTTLIEHISSFFHDKNKLYLANTNTAVNNLRQRLDIQNSSFYTVASYIANKNNISKKFDIVFIDECSTISNKDIFSVLDDIKLQCEILICVGDVYQIESIRFGNWFLFAQNFFSDIQLELKHIYRTKSEKLQLLWEKVRILDESMLEAIEKNNSSENIQNFNFSRSVNDEIILCLNYGGIYGVNNINKFLQENNPHKSFYFNGLSYKVDDPILFNENSSRFGEEFHNNLKGVITNIEEDEKTINFTIKIDKIIQSINNNFKVIAKDDKSTEIKFSVARLNSDEEDDNNNIVPFQVAYAISIHKAQGLEYDKVSIIVANEIEEQITHNIFYTAITRAKKELKIYWSAETENKILKSLKIKGLNRDFYLFKNNIKSHLTYARC